MSNATASAYSAGAAAWARGPARVYTRLAEELVARSPMRLGGRRVLDLGAGTGAVSHVLDDADVVALDPAVGMLQQDSGNRPPAVAGDGLALPFRSGAFDAVVAAFSLNHLADPVAGAREAARVSRAYVLASSYADGDGHPVRQAVDRALTDAGWHPPPWYAAIKEAAAAWGTVDRAGHILRRAGLQPVRVEQVHVAFSELTPRDLVDWRLGMAQHAAFVAAHDAGALAARALDLLPPDAGPLVRSVVFSVARVR